ncbi:thiamine-phosphate kinase [Paenibacillus algorifonticola]|uniref:Thiamine-monophosphate kinase n=1 Tax=Paenibacillus algorifonticola TaxID=684063 RepID=A0A1I2EX73_9BACL|nr:thiamine-phosphate kinase [Paenibacillus algorifonticola]SFE97475.1 thiamine-phosphate kinase [Paenibacillus algorifonticola]
MDEFASISHWTAGRQPADWQQQRGVTLGIGDDTAIIAPAAMADELEGPLELLMSVDTMVETVHFNAYTMTDEDIGYKALAANVSDIAAMGGVPRHALVSVSVPAAYGPERIARLYDGLYACAADYGVAIVGGDTTSSPQHLVVAVTVTGAVEAGRALRRSGAKPGDAVVLTGAVGLSAAGLHLLLARKQERQEQTAREAVESGETGGASDASDASGTQPAGDLQAASSAGVSNQAQHEEVRGAAALIGAHCRPAPSVRAGRLLLERGSCHSLNDVSDGLASEAWEIAEASQCCLVLKEDLLPRSGSMAAYAADVGIDPLEWMLYGGEDYVLLGTMQAADVQAAQEAFRAEGLPFYIVGEVKHGAPSVELELSLSAKATKAGSAAAKRMPLAKRGYNHFKK